MIGTGGAVGDEEREQLAEEQARLVAALTGVADAPAGFDGDAVGLAARSLINKRCAAVGKTWPAMAEALGEQFKRLFEMYARLHAAPEKGAVEDGWRFAEHLLAARQLPDEGRVQLALHRVARGHVGMTTIRMGGRARLAIAFRLPWGRARWFEIPWPRGK